MSKYIEWEMQQHPDFFKSSPSGKYTDLSIVRHVVSNVNPPDGEVDEAFMKILNAVAEEMNLIPALDDVVKVVRCNECRHHEDEPEKLKLGDIPPKQGECWCNWWDSAVNLSGFCNCGERIEE